MSRRRASSGGPAGLLANAGAMMASRLLIALLGWTGSILVIRHLSVDDFGRFTFVFGLLGLMAVVTDLGIGRVAVSGLLDEGPGRARFAGSYILLRVAMGLAGYLVALGFVLLAGYDARIVAATAIAGVVVVLATPSNAYQTVFEAHRRQRPVALLLVASRAAQLAATVAVVVAGGTLLWFLVPAVLAEVVLLGAIVPMAHRLGAFTYRPDLRRWWALLGEAVPLSVGTALATIYFRVDSIMLSWLGGFAAVGVYGVAYKFVELAHFLPEALGAALLPLLVTTWPHHADQLRYTVRRGFVVSALAGTGIAVLFGVFAGDVIGLLYGPEYVAGAFAARIVVLSECLTFATQLAVVVLIATGRQRRYPAITGLGLLLNVGLNLVLIPRFSYTGAAVATLVTDVCVLVAMTAELRRTPGMRPLPRPPMPRILAAGLLAGGVGYALDLVLWWGAALAVAVAVYAVAVPAFRAAGPAGLRALMHDSPPGEVGGRVRSR